MPTLLQGARTLWTGINLAPHAEHTILISGTLGAFNKNQGWDLTINTQTSTTGKELVLSNNIATISQHFSGLADLTTNLQM
jgi:hypothetical protein